MSRDNYTPIASLETLQKAKSQLDEMPKEVREAITKWLSSNSSCGYKALAYLAKGISPYAMKSAEAQVLAYQAEARQDWPTAAEIWEGLREVVPDAGSKADAAKAKFQAKINSQRKGNSAAEKTAAKKADLVARAEKLGIKAAKGMAYKTLLAIVERKEAEQALRSEPVPAK